MQVKIGNQVKLKSLGDHKLKAFQNMDLIGKEFEVLDIQKVSNLNPKFAKYIKQDYYVYGLFKWPYGIKHLAWFKRSDFDLVELDRLIKRKSMETN